MIGVLRFLRRHGPLIVIGFLFGYLTFHIFSGKQGLFQLAGYEREIDRYQDELAKAKSLRLDLERQAKQLKSETLSGDMLEQYARRQLGHSHVNDIVIILDD